MFGKTAIRNIVASGLGRRGYELKERAAPPRGFRSFLEIYKRRMRGPRTVFDIGVGRGTQWLYDSFPDADLVLIEPLVSFEPHIRKILDSRRAVWHRCALGDVPGEARMQVPRGTPTGASMLPRFRDGKLVTPELRPEVLEEVVAPVRVLDEIGEGAEPPFVIKIDVEGLEVKVLNGGEKTLRSADLVIVEASIGSRYAGECDLIDIGGVLKAHGFKLAEIIEMATVGPDKLLNYVDAAFVRTDGGFWREPA